MIDVREHEKIAREIEKTSESIHKKHSALKTDRIDEDMVLNRHFKSIIKSLRQIVDSPGMRVIKRQSRDDDAASAPKCERKKEEEKKEEEGQKASETFEHFAIPRKSDDLSHHCVQPITFTPRTTIVPMIESLENVFQTTDDLLAIKI